MWNHVANDRNDRKTAITTTITTTTMIHNNNTNDNDNNNNDARNIMSVIIKRDKDIKSGAS